MDIIKCFHQKGQPWVRRLLPSLKENIVSSFIFLNHSSSKWTSTVLRCPAGLVLGLGTRILMQISIAVAAAAHILKWIRFFSNNCYITSRSFIKSQLEPENYSLYLGYALTLQVWYIDNNFIHLLMEKTYTVKSKFYKVKSFLNWIWLKYTVNHGRLN